MMFFLNNFLYPFFAQMYNVCFAVFYDAKVINFN